MEDDRASQTYSKVTRSSGALSEAARARGRAEAARVRAAFAEQEAKMRLEKAKLDAELCILAHQKEAAAAVAEADALEVALDGDNRHGGSKSSLPLSQKDVMQRTEEYVERHMPVLQPIINLPPTIHSSQVMQPVSSVFPSTNQNVQQDSKANNPVVLPSLSPIRTQMVSAPSYHRPAHTNAPPRDQDSTQNPDPMNNFAKYLAKRELITTGLSHFDDQPESFRAWQSSFRSATYDLGLTAKEELDLLLKWLGKESSEHVRRIRAVHVYDPETALRKSWERLKEHYAAPEVIESILFHKLDSFPRLASRDHLKLRQLGDVLREVESAKEDGYLPGLAYLDTARGINPIVEKLPHGLQEKWITKGSRYKNQNDAHFPPFSFFVDFIYSEAKTRNDPSFVFSTHPSGPVRNEKPYARNANTRAPITVHKTDVATADKSSSSTVTKDDPSRNCPIHHKPHSLRKCRGFRSKTIDERKTFLREQGICFKCCASSSHLARDCGFATKCNECESDRHIAAMHPGPAPWTLKASVPAPHHGGEEESGSTTPSAVTAKCTEVCGEGLPARSCSKICLVKVYPQNKYENAAEMYAIIDDQSNKSLARSEFFDLFNIQSSSSLYSLRTCAGVTKMTGRKAEGFQIEAANGGVSLTLPPLIECNEIPNNRAEIPTPEAALHHPHLKPVASLVPELDPKAEILLLLGRDILRAHKVREQVNGPHDAPFAQRLDLGWVLVGDVCIGNAHKPTINSFKTHILENGRPSLLTPCLSRIHLTEMMSYGGEPHEKAPQAFNASPVKKSADKLGSDVFQGTPDDNKPALSIEDTIFLKTMEKELYKDEANSWVAPLPFRVPRRPLPNNREQAVTRLNSLRRSLDKKPVMKEQYLAFMNKLLENDHAEVAPPLQEGEERWYLPTFGVYHPQKPDQIRVVFDSSAKHDGISLNDVLLTGPDLNNSLLGVLIRFRKEPVAVIADIQQMFYCFAVREDHRNYLRFLWYRDNDLTKDVIEYRMKVHVFGNSPSPAVAIYGLRRAAQEGEPTYGSGTREFVERHFYVDDGLASVPTDEQAIDLLQRTQSSLAESNLRLHKVASNSPSVMQAFPQEDHAKGMKDFGLGDETGPVQRSLGLCWETAPDTFTFKVSTKDKPFTRRGVLSTVNSLFDPLGLVAPVTIQGRAMLRELTIDSSGWDTPLPEDRMKEWEAWKDSLQCLEQLHIPRTYASKSLTKVQKTELCLFSDASTRAIGAVAYLRTTDESGKVEIGFVLGKSKLAPLLQPTIPRLELCAAVLAVEMADFILDEIDFKPEAVKFYCDSKVVLGYICNETKRFYVYVHNRVQRIRQSTSPEQWHYVPTEHNPADHASRAVSASQLTDTSWFTGPTFLLKADHAQKEENPFDLISPEMDADIRPEVRSFVTQTDKRQLTSKRFEHFSTWNSLLRGVAFLIHVARSYKNSENKSAECRGWHVCHKPRTPDELDQAKQVILKTIQEEAYSDELAALNQKRDAPQTSSILKLNPKVENELLIVGGRLKHAQLESHEKHPTIIPKHGHIATLLIRHYHQQVEHQGRHFTEGAIRSAGFWIVGAKRLISSAIHKCVTCRKLRGKMENQQMADLPPERLSTTPPFSYVGLDVFGPWTVAARRTRGGHAQSKRWVVLLTCMSTRAVHFEVLESMDASSCINALRRFFAIRGPAIQLRSDCGTNFIGACNELQFDKKRPEDTDVHRYLSSHGCTWVFNPPHSSHMGGSWERMIGVTRRILDSMLFHNKSPLTHETLCTFLAEAAAIINARPLVPVSTDPESPFILTPAMLLTQKAGTPPPPGNFTEKDLFKSQWRQVQSLATKFWSRWSREYLATLQSRRKWTQTQRNLVEGDLVLLKDKQVVRNEWPLALVSSVLPGDDEKVRIVEVKVAAPGGIKKFVRPVTELVLLLPNED